MLLNAAKKSIQKVRSLIYARRKLVEINYTVNFPMEKNTKLLLSKDYTLKSFYMTFRNTKEPAKRVVLETLISQLFPTNTFILDVGAYIGDNSLPWSMCFKKHNIVAIDPSISNCNFINDVAFLNNIKNIQVINCLISDINAQYKAINDIDHSAFEQDLNPRSKSQTIQSKSIDEITINLSNKVSLIHIDVEGMEKNVILSSRDTISRDRPLIVFEDHLRDKTLENLSALLTSMNYAVCLINEVIEGNRPDCRNYLALPYEVKDSALELLNKIPLSHLDNWFPVIGSSLILEKESV